MDLQRTLLCVVSLALVVVAIPSEADAVFDPIPDDDEFAPFLCSGEPAWDPYRDAAGGTDHRDPVGDETRPAALRTATDSHLYLRMRLDGDPSNDPEGLKSFGWGYLFDAPPSNFDDGDPATNTYDYLLHLEGQGGSGGVLRFRSNEGQTEMDDPTAPAAGDLLWEFEHTTADPIWHVKEATGEPYAGGDADYWLTIAVAWDQLEEYGIVPESVAIVWMGTSNSNQAINVDFICHDGDDDDPLDMTNTNSDPEPLDPDVDDDGDWGDGDGSNGDGDGSNGDGDFADPHEFVDAGGGAGEYSLTGGGPSCSVATSTTGLGGGLLIAILFALMLFFRRSGATKPARFQR